jgi:hypothetical protein
MKLTWHATKFMNKDYTHSGQGLIALSVTDQGVY